MDYKGIIIEESLQNPAALQNITITGTRVEPVTKAHKTPWLKQWTLHSVAIPADQIDQVANQISATLADNYWYADFKNDTIHYIIFPGKVFRVNRARSEEYQAATAYGVSLGIPTYQLDFSPHIVHWERG